MTKYVVQAAWQDAPHLDANAREELAKSYPPHERAARTQGVPQLGSGAIYPVPESDIVCEPFQIPVFFRHLYGLDVGWNRTAAGWFAYDGDNDIAYIYSEHYQSAEKPAVHAEAIKARGNWIPGLIDSAARGRSQADGQRLLEQYQALGLDLTPCEKLRRDGRDPVEASIYEVWSRLSTGRLKVFRTCQNWLMEFRIYRRDEKGKVEKSNDHLMDLTRYVCFAGFSMAAMHPREHWARMMPGPRQAPRHQSEYDPFQECYAGMPEQPRSSSPWRRTG